MKFESDTVAHDAAIFPAASISPTRRAVSSPMLIQHFELEIRPHFTRPQENTCVCDFVINVYNAGTHFVSSPARSFAVCHR